MSYEPKAIGPAGITMGFPLDQLFDQDCGLTKWDVRRPAVKLAEQKIPKVFRPGDIVDVDGLLGKIPKDAPWAGVVRKYIKGVYNGHDVEAEESRTRNWRRKATAIASVLNDFLATDKFEEFFETCSDKNKNCNEYKTPQDRRSFIERQMRKYVSQTPGPQTATGNVVICGGPGTAKSTLALQFAACCARIEMNASVPLYISLEATTSELKAKAEPFGWDQHLREIRHLHNVGDTVSAKELGGILKTCVSNYGDSVEGCPSHVSPEKWREQKLSSLACGKCAATSTEYGPCILVSSLSPRPLEAIVDHGTLFETRFQQLERLLEAGQAVRDDMRSPQHSEQWHIRHFMPLVIIDSLNMFGMQILNRDEVYRLFTLFKRCKTTGVFVVETSQDTPFDSTMADVVISLRQEEDNGYSFRYIEIEKSRYYHQVYGKHPFRTLPLPAGTLVPSVDGYDTITCEKKIPRHGVVIYPSLHYLVLKTDREPPVKKSNAEKTNFDFGIPAFSKILPHTLKRNKAVMLAGPRGTFKSTFGFNFLAKGMMENESVMLIRLSETRLLEPKDQDVKDSIPMAIPPCVAKNKEGDKKKDTSGFNPKKLKCVSGGEDKDILWQNLSPSSKIVTTVWQYNNNKGCLFEMDFKGGALLPEEFVQIVREVLIRRQEKDRIRRVVLDDVSQMGVSYPFLRHSRASGDLLLSAFVHLMRNHEIDLVMTGTTGELGQANDMVSRACALADTVVFCRFLDVFGDRYVTVSGEGLMAGKGTQSRSIGESVPAVVILKGSDKEVKIDVDCQYLEGLVGFDRGLIHRPGLSVQLFNEGKVQDLYSDEIAMLLRSVFSVTPEPHRTKSREFQFNPDKVAGLPESALCAVSEDTESHLSVIRFDSDLSDAVHDSLGVLQGRPLDRTVLCTVDEFYMAPSSARKKDLVPIEDWKVEKDEYLVSLGEIDKSLLGIPYYANVLLLAYRMDWASQDNLNFSRWKMIRDFMNTNEVEKKAGDKSGPVRFDFDLLAKETLVCAFIDAIVVGCGGVTRNDIDLKNGTQTELSQTDISRGESVIEMLTKKLQKADKQEQVAGELYALQELFHNSQKYDKRDKILADPNSPERRLNPESTLYLCWYSQLRDLIFQHPHLSEELKVCSLPGGGFRGDWFLGIVNGSVSVALGKSVIEILCGEKEEYKRFIRGVGLPVTKRFYSEKSIDPVTGYFYAWPGAKVPLDDVLMIHRNALVRSKISGYRKFRPALYALCKQLAFGEKMTLNEIRERCVARLPGIIEKLNPSRVRVPGKNQTGK